MLIHCQINVPQTLVCRMLIIPKTIRVCQGGLVAYKKKKSLHLQLCNKLKAALRKFLHLYHTLPPKVQGSRKMKYCKNQRKWMTTNCTLATAQQLYKWNDSSHDCPYKTSRRYILLKNHSMKRGGTPALSRRVIGDWSPAGRGEFFSFRDVVSERLPLYQ